MKKSFLFLVILYPVMVAGQNNVGIGTTTPRAALAIHGNSFVGTPDGAQLLLYEEENDFARLRMTNSLHSAENNKFWDIAARISNGTAGSNDRLNIFLNGYGDVISLNGLGNVGIGGSAPVAARVLLSYPNAVPLILQGGAGLYLPFFENADYRGYIGSYSGNASDVDFGTGAGNTTGKVHLTIQTSPKLTIREDGNVGIGNTNPLWPLDVNGAMRLNGRLVVNGTGGLAGQVLTSGGGVNAPTWSTLSGAYDNNIRFSFTMSNNSVTSGELTVGTRYNTNAPAVSVSGTDITFSQTGIYHFDLAISGRLTYGSAVGYDPDFTVNFYLNGGSGPGNNPVAGTSLTKNGNSNTYANTAHGSFDMYIQAGQVLNVMFSYSNFPAGYTILDTFGYVRGYLISN